MGYTNPKTVTLSLPQTSLAAPLDATEYFSGGCGLAWAASTTARRIYVPFKCVIRKAFIFSTASVTAGSGESWTMRIVVNGTTSYDVQAITVANAIRNWSNTDLNIPLESGDYFMFATTTPTWATNPEGFYSNWVVILEYE